MRIRMLTIAVLGLLVSGGAAFGQEITGQIRGIVTDASGATIANATVTITNMDRNLVLRTVETDSAGEYVAPFLPVGRYSVAVEFKGFKKFVQNDIQRSDGGLHVQFTEKDRTASVLVDYKGTLPDIFKPGVTVVAEGSLGADGVFHARTVLAKCPSRFSTTPYVQ